MNAAELARALHAKRSGNQWSCKCPAHDDKTPSLIFWQGHSAIRFKCYSGCSPEDVIAALRKRGLWEQNGADKSGQSLAREQSDNRKLALDIWGEARSISNTAAEYYLAMRGLWVPPELNGSLARFHPQCPRGATRCPALVVLMRGLRNDVPGAIQRIYIARDYTADKKMMLGPAGVCAMKLGVPTSHLTICEGFETGLGLRALGYDPVWAVGSAGAIARFPVIEGISCLTVAVDNDHAGLSALGAVCERWGERANGIMVEREGADFADLAREQNDEL